MLYNAESTIAHWPSPRPDWVEAFERRAFVIGTRRVALEVQGAIEDRRGRWVQIACVDNLTLTMLLHILPGAEMRDVVRALLSINGRAPWPTILEVRPRVRVDVNTPQGTNTTIATFSRIDGERRAADAQCD